MVYDRRHRERELNFEASGALRGAALIMRDRETDSWWSIMTSSAIGGALEGTELVELPVGRKMTWGEWKKLYPDTLALSVEGAEHIEESPYAGYFESGDTFRDIPLDDRRLEPKVPIFGGWIDGRPYAVAHSDFDGGAVFPLDGGRSLLLFRESGSPIFASSRAYLLAGEVDRPAIELLEAIDSDLLVAEPVSGFDTFWYTWALTNGDTVLLP